MLPVTEALSSTAPKKASMAGHSKALVVTDTRRQPTFIYEVLDPGTGKVVYVGKTTVFDRRWTAHESKHSKCKLLRALIASRAKDDKKLTFRRVEELPDGVPACRAEASLKASSFVSDAPCTILKTVHMGATQTMPTTLAIWTTPPWRPR